MSCFNDWTLLAIILNCFVCALSQRVWNFEVLDATAHSSDEEKLNVTMQVHKITFSVAAFSAEVVVNFDANDDTMVKLRTAFSKSGRSNEFIDMPYSVPKQSAYAFADEYYDGLVYPNIGVCSNLPKVIPRPFERKTYKFVNCTLSGDGYPQVLPFGYYQLWVELSGEVDFKLCFTIKLTPKTL